MSVETETPVDEIQQPWGRLVPCSATLTSIVLDKNSVKIGRGKRCDIIIDESRTQVKDTNISKEHCMIFKNSTDENIYIKDLSKNGTFLNGTKIGTNNISVLNANDKISIVKDVIVYIFQRITYEELPDTLTSPSSLESPTVAPKVTISIWGRLISCVLYLDSFDLHQASFKVGRSSQCDAVIDLMKIDSVLKKRFSKEQFIIWKDPESHIIFIKDLSNVGTYLNGRLIGKNNQNVLQQDDTISIGRKRKRVYAFKSMLPSEASYLPPQLVKKYEVSVLLGKGACGEVRLAYEKHTCKTYAIKRIVKGRSTLSQLHKLNHPSKIETEIKILKALSHPFVINMKDIVEMDSEVFLVLEYMKGGELSNLILSLTPLKECNVKYLFYQIVLAVEYLHSKGITHRDLKPENVLLASHDPETRVKVSDFGLSKITEEDDMMRTMCGTLTYVAPEVLNTGIPLYDKQVDVWSLGVILFYMLSKELPFRSRDEPTLRRLIMTGSYVMDDSTWGSVSDLAKDLVRKMLTVNPQERITIGAVLGHPWIAGDVAVQYGIKLLESKDSDSNEEVESSYETGPAPKRVRLSCSDESS